MSYTGQILPANKAWLGSLPVGNRYTYGIAGEKFFRKIKDEGKFYGTNCPKCNHLYVPAVLYCERCFSELTEWVDVGIEGEVHSYTFLYVDLDGNRVDVPLIVAFVKIGDGGIIHLINEASMEEVKIGMKVVAVIKPISERIGSITDILYFKPI